MSSTARTAKNDHETLHSARARRVPSRVESLGGENQRVIGANEASTIDAPRNAGAECITGHYALRIMPYAASRYTVRPTDATSLDSVTLDYCRGRIKRCRRALHSAAITSTFVGRVSPFRPTRCPHCSNGCVLP